jgi:Protein of unknown function (DUF2917)
MPFDFTPKLRTRSTFLPRRGSLILDDAEGTVISVDSGCLWVTLENDPRDVVLFKGMRFEIDRTGRTVVAAEEDSLLRLTPTPQPATRVLAALAAASKRAFTRSVRAFQQRVACRQLPYY